ncbi:MAG TPA: hypothetical protein VMH89_14260, partial [Candidatus Acidoferrum sp.]|nr:hypothetical protein [Candidatus Acidoferrum sp.]
MNFSLKPAIRSERNGGAVPRGMWLLPAAALVVSSFAGCKPTEHHAPDVWAVVNGTEIKRDEVEKYYKTRINPEAQETSPEEVLSG